MKWKFNVVKTITTPIEIEADNFNDAITKAFAAIPEKDTDKGSVSSHIDTTPSDSLIKWREE